MKKDCNMTMLNEGKLGVYFTMCGKEMTANQLDCF